jgi:hypothetical protein
VFFVPVWFFFSISWVTSSLIFFFIFIFNSLIFLFILLSLSLWCLFRALLSSFISVSSHILYFWCLEIFWVYLVHFD